MAEIEPAGPGGTDPAAEPRTPSDELTPAERRDAALSTILSLAEAAFLLASGRATGGVIALLFALSSYPYYTLAKRMLRAPLTPRGAREAAWAYGLAFAFTVGHAALFYSGWTRAGIGASLGVALVMAMLLWAAPSVRNLRENETGDG